MQALQGVIARRSGLELSDLSDFLPRQLYLNDIDPAGKRPLAELRDQIVKRVHQYYDLVVRRQLEGGNKLNNGNLNVVDF